MIDAKIRKKRGQFFLNSEISGSGFICIYGKNGSGKTTLLSCIAGILNIDEGKIILNGKDVTRVPVNKRNVVFATYNSFIPNLRIIEHLKFGAKLKNRDVNVEDIVNDFKLNKDGYVGNQSLGNKSKISLLTAILAKPDLILVDELFSNIDEKKEFMRRYKELAKNSVVDVIYTTQHSEDLDLADVTYILKEGRSEPLVKQSNC